MKNYTKILFITSAVVLLAVGCNQQQVQKQQSQNQVVSQVSAIKVTQTVEGSNLNQPSYQIAAGKTAIDLLKQSHQVQTKEYQSLGEFVLSIDGNASDSKHFWEFFVNDKSSNVGASSYKLKDGDKLEWKLSAISNDKN
jgi:hypothetical protein